MKWLETLLVLGGVMHLGILPAGVMMTIVLEWRRVLASLSGLTRHVIWTHGIFVSMTIAAFGAVSLALPATLADGTPLARAVCGFIALFWGSRLVIQFFLFDARPYLTSWFLRLGYHGLTAVFTYLTLVYGFAALRPMI